MNAKKGNGGFAGYVMIAVLAALLGVGIWLMPEGEPTFGDVEDEREALVERWQGYIELRRAREWTRIYDEYIDPGHRTRISPAQFAELYGDRYVELRGVELGAVEVDPRTQRAELSAKIELELVPERLPEPYRSSFEMPDDPSYLVNAEDLTREWVWRRGEWYLLAEEEILKQVEPRAARQAPPLGQKR